MNLLWKSLLILWISAPLAAACVGCREPGSDVVARESQTVAAGVAFSSSVIFMLIVVLLMVSGLAAYIWKTCRQLERSRS